MNYLKKYKYLVFLLMLLVIIIYFFTSKNVSPKIEAVEIIKEETVVDNIEEKTIKVDVKGAVFNPGVYEMELGSRVIDVINKSGGLKKDSDTSIINLSKTIEDEMIIIVYTKSEVQEMNKEEVKIEYIEKECNCPEINDACVTIEEIKEILNFESKEEFESNEQDDKISINNASKEELMTLPGIGEAKANNIIEYRNNTKFNNIEEIINVNGISDSIYDKIKDKISL